MRTFLMSLLAVVIVGLLFLGNIGPVEIVVWLALVAAWLVAFFLWARPGDRRSRPNGAT